MIITDNFLYWHLKQLYLFSDIESHIAVIQVPQDKNEELFFSKLQFNSFSLITTVSCSESTLLVYGFGPKIALTCEITFSSAFSNFSKASDLWPVLSRINLYEPLH